MVIRVAETEKAGPFYLGLLRLPLIPSPELVQLHSFIWGVACKKQIVFRLDGKSKTHKKKAVYTHCCRSPATKQFHSTSDKTGYVRLSAGFVSISRELLWAAARWKASMINCVIHICFARTENCSHINDMDINQIGQGVLVFMVSTCCHVWGNHRWVFLGVSQSLQQEDQIKYGLVISRNPHTTKVPDDNYPSERNFRSQQGYVT